MKGNLSQFESRVNDVIIETCGSYKGTIETIFKLPTDKKNKRVRPYENDLADILGER